MQGAPDPQLPGLRRARWVRMTVEGGITRFEVVGTGHRLPVVRPIPARTAATLIAAGVPVRGGRSSEAALPSRQPAEA